MVTVAIVLVLVVVAAAAGVEVLRYIIIMIIFVALVVVVFIAGVSKSNGWRISILLRYPPRYVPFTTFSVHLEHTHTSLQSVRHTNREKTDTC